MEDWALIRRLAADGVPKARIAERLGISRTTVIKAVNSDAPPRYVRTPGPTSFTEFEPHVRALLEQTPDMPATVLAERVGWTGSIRWFSDNVRRLRPEHVRVDPADRITWTAGDAARCDLWFPPIELPVGFGQIRRPTQLPVLTMVTGYSRWDSAVLIPTRSAPISPGPAVVAKESTTPTFSSGSLLRCFDARIYGEATAAIIERRQRICPQPDNGDALRFQHFERQRQIENGFCARTDDRYRCPSQFDEVCRHVERMTAMHTANAPGGKNGNACAVGQNHRAGHSCGPIFLASQGELAFAGDPLVSIELVGAGLITAVPLLFFAAAARRVPPWRRSRVRCGGWSSSGSVAGSPPRCSPGAAPRRWSGAPRRGLR